MTVLNRSHAALLVESAGKLTLCDCGEGTARSLLRHHFDPLDISRIVVTHTHPDHCSSIPIILQYMHLKDRKKSLDIYLPKGTVEVFQNYLNQLYLLNGKLSFSYALVDYKEGVFFDNDTFKITAIANRHLEGYADFAARLGISLASYSLVFEEGGKRIYYSADLKDPSDLNPPVGTDVMIVESTHIPAVPAFTTASARNIRRIIFTHLGPDMDLTPLSDELTTADFAFDGMEVSV